MAISTKISLKFDGAAVKRGLASIKKQFSELNKRGGEMLGSLAGSATKMAAILGPAAIGVGIAKIGLDAVSAASSVESLTSQFKTLLGSQDAAVKRMAELEKFAASTPYEVSEIAATSKMLQTLGGELLSTGDGLMMVGDAAAMAGHPLSEVGLHVGRLFGALTSGTSAGEATARLQELGLISGKSKQQFEDLAEAQEKGKAKTLSNAEALNVLNQVLRKSKGSMADLANTTEGKFSNLKDSYTQLLVKLGTPINTALRPLIDDLSSRFSKFGTDATQIGEKTGQALRMIYNSFANGDIGSVIKNTFMLAVKLAGAELIALAATAGDLFAQAAKGNVGKGFVKWLEDINPIRKASESMGYYGPKASESEFFKTKYDGYSHQQYRDASYEMVGVDAAKAAFEETLKRNQSMLPEGFRYAKPGETSIFSDGVGNKLIQLLEGVNQKLSPQP